jgi:predicted dehydrogenase
MNPKISGGGVLMDLGIQMLDICLWILGNPKVEKVSAISARTVTGRKVEDTVFAFYRLRGGTSLTIDVSWSLMADESVAYTLFYGKQGSAELNPLKITKEMHGDLVNVTPGKSHTPLDLYKKSFEFEVDHFVQSILHKRKTISSVEDAADVMAVIEATYRSIAEGQEIAMAES